MNLFIEKLDGRFAGHKEFSHRAVILGPWEQRPKDFIAVRGWCIENFGHGVERDLHWCVPETTWAWHINEGPTGYYIYLAYANLTLFSLKWK